MAQHKWSEKSRPSEHETVRTCLVCGMVSVGRHEGIVHWAEFYDTDGKRIMAIRTPECDPPRVKG